MATQGFFPATEPVASPVGLLHSDGVEVIKHPPSEDGWITGPQDVELLSGAFDLILSDYCSGAPDALVQESTGVCKATTYPFGIVAGYPVVSLGAGLSEEERKRRVMHAADVLTQKAVEHELWTGDLAMSADHFDAYYLAMFGSIDVGAGGGSAANHALAALEWALGQCSAGTGVIHMTRDVASRLTYFLIKDGNKLSTVLGTPVVVGSGYTGSAPAGSVPVATVPFPAVPVIGTAPTTAWMYATGPVTVHLGSVQYIGERRDSVTNEIIAMAGRPAEVYWDSSCHFAAEVNLATAID